MKLSKWRLDMYERIAKQNKCHCVFFEDKILGIKVAVETCDNCVNKMSVAGFKASEAGEKLKNMLLRLKEDNRKESKAGSVCSEPCMRNNNHDRFCVRCANEAVKIMT